MFKSSLLLFSFLILSTFTDAYAAPFRPKLGVGVSNQLLNDIPAISLKLQKSREVAIGALLNMSTDDTRGGMGAGIKVFRIIFEEPQLNFYASGLGGIIKQKVESISKTGFQFDFTLGSEFSFQGLQSLGFSFEVGVSLNKINNFVIETTGQSFVTGAIHFYL